jgi:hypothetical protein
VTDKTPKQPASEVIVDLEVYRRCLPVFAARKAFGLLLPGETLQDFYRYILEWEQERSEEPYDEEEVQRGLQAPLRHS